MNDNKRTRTTLANGPHTAVLTETGIDAADLVVTMAKEDGGSMIAFPLYSGEEATLVVQLLRATGWQVTRVESLEEEISWQDSVTVTVDCDPAKEVEL